MFPPKVLPTNRERPERLCSLRRSLSILLHPYPHPPSPHLKRDVQAESQAERIAEFALQWDEPTDVAFVAAHVLDSERGVM